MRKLLTRIGNKFNEGAPKQFASTFCTTKKVPTLKNRLDNNETLVLFATFISKIV